MTRQHSIATSLKTTIFYSTDCSVHGWTTVSGSPYSSLTNVHPSVQENWAHRRLLLPSAQLDAGFGAIPCLINAGSNNGSSFLEFDFIRALTTGADISLSYKMLVQLLEFPVSIKHLYFRRSGSANSDNIHRFLCAVPSISMK